jgi:uncharacterized cupredoxin-like copper-binding protein
MRHLMRDRSRDMYTLGAIVLAVMSVVLIGVVVAGPSAKIVGSTSATSCSAPALPGAVVELNLVEYKISADKATVNHGSVSLVVTNNGTMVHEMIVLPLDSGQAVGTRTTDAELQVSEATSLGEASNSCGADAGDGIAAHAVGWTTLTLDPGRYELICNLPGHYANGMYVLLTVS